MKQGNRLSNKICPENMTIEEWQVALRRETARESDFVVEHLDKSRIWGDYLVCSPTGRYRVAFRGVQSDRNFCSCLDFRTNGLGTCKHLEAVSLFLEKDVPGYPWANLSFAPEYTSIYVSYKGGRSIRIRVGTVCSEEFEKKIKERYFDSEGALRKEYYSNLMKICQEALAISSAFRCYEDAYDFSDEYTDAEKWCNEIHGNYPEGAIPWNKQELSEEYTPIEQLLYRLTHRGFGFLVGPKHPFYIHLIARLTEEIYLCEEDRQKGFIIVENDTDILLWQSILLQYSEYIHLPVQVLSQQQFLKLQLPQGAHTTFVYVHDSDGLKEWKNPLSLAIKHLSIKHLYMHVERIEPFTPVQLSSVLQHINPFIIGPFYKFIHSYRPMFPLQPSMDAIPEEMRHFTTFVTQQLASAPILPMGDTGRAAVQEGVEVVPSPEARVRKFLGMLHDILEDPDSSKILQTYLKQLPIGR